MPDSNIAQLAGAALFDTAAKRLGKVSAESFDRYGAEDRQAMVDVLHQALQAAMAQGPDFRFGFLLPLAELIDNTRLGLVPSADWSGAAVLREAQACSAVQP
jgi:hypothetical protein